MDELIKGYVLGGKKQAKNLSKLMNALLFQFLASELTITDNKIEYSATNLNNLEDAFNKANKGILGKLGEYKDYVIGAIANIFANTQGEAKKYNTREVFASDSVLDKARKHSSTTVNKLANLERVFLELKEKALSQISTYEGIGLKELRRYLLKEIEEKDIVDKYFSRWSYDIYSQYQRIAANEIRLKLGLRFAIYEGGTMEATRPFCQNNNGKVFHEDEIQQFRTKNWKGKQASGYNPIYDLGGYNCRHRLNWISDELAFRLRPELKEQYEVA